MSRELKQSTLKPSDSEQSSVVAESTKKSKNNPTNTNTASTSNKRPTQKMQQSEEEVLMTQKKETISLTTKGRKSNAQQPPAQTWKGFASNVTAKPGAKVQQSSQESNEQTKKLAKAVTQNIAKNKKRQLSSDQEDDRITSKKASFTAAKNKKQVVFGKRVQKEQSEQQSDNSSKSRTPKSQHRKTVKYVESDEQSEQAPGSREGSESDQQSSSEPKKEKPIKFQPKKSVKRIQLEQSDDDQSQQRPLAKTKKGSKQIRVVTHQKKTLNRKQSSSQSEAEQPAPTKKAPVKNVIKIIEEQSDQQSQVKEPTKGKASTDKVKTNIKTSQKRVERESQMQQEDQQGQFQVAVHRLSFNTSSGDVRQLFGEYGNVTNVKMVNRSDGKPKGSAFVSFSSKNSFNKALQLDGTKYMGRSIIVQESRGRTNNNQRGGQVGKEVQSGTVVIQTPTLLIEGLSYSSTVDSIKKFFAPCGEVQSVRIITDRTGNPRGFGYVQFYDVKTARKAYKQLNGKYLDGRSIRLDSAVHRQNRNQGETGEYGGSQGASGPRGKDRQGYSAVALSQDDKNAQKGAIASFAGKKIMLQQNSISIAQKRQKKDRNEISEGEANLAVEIIRKISASPNLKELEQKSLRDQLIEMIKEAKVNSEEKSIFYKLFRDGIPYMQSLKIAFDQKRIKDALQMQDAQDELNNLDRLLLFNPISSVTSQIFSNVIFGLGDYLISYGHFGISKTFGYYILKILCDIIIKWRIQTQESDNGTGILHSNKYHYQRIPKIFYMTISKGKKIQSFQQELKRSFLQQCPQISKQLQTQDKTLISLLKQIVLYYRTRNIRVILVVDQINAVASVFRQKYINQKKNIEVNKTKQEYQRVDYFNQLRVDIIQNVQFNRVIYNSSVNNQALFKNSDFSQRENQWLMSKIKQDLRLFRQFEHNSTQEIMQQRVLYPQIAHFDSSIWSLADCFLFEVENSTPPKTQVVQIDRRKVFQAFKQLTKKMTITPLIIRQSVQNFIGYYMTPIIKKKPQVKPQEVKLEFNKNNFLCVLNVIQKNTKERVNSSLQKLMGKLVKNSERQKVTMALFLKAEIALVSQNLITIREQEQQGDKQQEDFSQTMNKRINNLFSPLETNSFCINHQEYEFKNIYANIDRHLFIYFQEQSKLKRYLQQFQLRVQRELTSECNQDQYIELDKLLDTEVKKLRQQLMQKGEVAGSNRPGLSLVISFLPFAEIKAILEPQMLHVMKTQLWMYQGQMRKLISDNNGAYGCLLEMYLINSLKQQKGKIKVKFTSSSDENKPFGIQIQKVQTFFSLAQTSSIKSNKNSKVQKANNHNFLDQFVDKALADKNISSMIFTPVTAVQEKHKSNSKAIDFVMTHRQTICLIIRFFDVGVSNKANQIQNKITKFVDCFVEFHKDFYKTKLVFEYFIVSGAHNFQKAKNAVKKQDKILQETKKQSQEQILQLLEQLFAQYQKQISRQKKGQINNKKQLVKQIIRHFDVFLVSRTKPKSQEVRKMLQSQKDLGQENLSQLKEEIMEVLKKRKQAYNNLQKIAIINSRDFEFSGEGLNINQTFFAAIRQAAVQYADNDKQSGRK